MNPILIFGVFLCAIILWFLLTFLFQPIGELIAHLWNDTMKAMDEENNNEEEKKHE